LTSRRRTENDWAVERLGQAAKKGALALIVPSLVENGALEMCGSLQILDRSLILWQRHNAKNVRVVMLHIRQTTPLVSRPSDDQKQTNQPAGQKKAREEGTGKASSPYFVQMGMGRCLGSSRHE